MTATGSEPALLSTDPPAPASARPRPRGRTSSVARHVLTAGVLLAAVTVAVSLAGLALDPRVIAGAPAWLKPLKFGVSIAAYLLTIRWLLPLLPARPRALATVSGMLVVAFGAELVLIVLQVLRGTTSHFNESTPLDATIYFTMGGFVGLLFVGTAVLAVLALRRRGLDPGTAWGIRLGLALCLLGMLAAGLMIANHTSSSSGGHTVGAADGGPGLPLTDWSLDHGDLRIAHFAGLHALQLLPLAAWALGRFTSLAGRVRARLLGVLAVGYGLGVVLLAWQAERGQALLRPDGGTLAAVGALLLATAAGVAVVLRAGRAATPAVVEAAA